MISVGGGRVLAATRTGVRRRGIMAGVATGGLDDVELEGIMRIAVIGAGAMGQWAVKELGMTPDVEAVVVGDVDRARAQAVASEKGGGKATTCFVDASDESHASLREALTGCDAMVNATQHFWNLNVMQAAASAGVHYTDMGGLFHVTRRQVELDGLFREAGVTAVIAMGGAPGVTNILAKHGAEQLDTIEEAHALCGNVDHTDWSAYPGWVPPYSLETLCDEFSV
ncbi:MAG: saccharopine dehydrogenase NADP-binding domain-containing protein, partial [Actinobacteria bacterium]|nr:saccharopine dehydrogenase NADP-binding domain-containing protein [Actinomycetota bacterium]